MRYFNKTFEKLHVTTQTRENNTAHGPYILQMYKYTENRYAPIGSYHFRNRLVFNI